MDAANKPLASAGLDGITTFNPGILAYQFSKAWECCELTRAAAPPAPRNTIGQSY